MADVEGEGLEGEDQGFTVPLVWVDADDATVSFCNQVLFQQAGPDEYVLTLGHVVPPPILGTDEQRREQVRRVSFVPVKTLGRFSLTQQRVEELIGVLQTVVEGDSERESPPETP